MDSNLLTSRLSMLFTRFIYIALLIFTFSLVVDAQIFKKKKNELTEQQKQDAEYNFTEGCKEYMLDNFGKAMNAFEKSLKSNDKSGATYYMIAQVYFKQGNFYKGIQFAQKAVELDENNKYYYLLLAQMYERKQDFKEAVKVYQALLKRIPNAIEYYYDLANIYIIIGNKEKAIECYDKIEKTFGISEDIIKQKQQLYISLNKLDEAIKQGQRLIDTYPDEPRHVISLVELLITNDKLAEAEKLVDGLLKNEPQNPYGILALSDIYKAKGDIRKSNEQLEKAFSNPELDIDAKIGILIGKLRQLPNDEIKEQCLVLGEILVKVHPNEAKAFAMYADILTITLKNPEALKNYKKAISLDNTHFKIWLQIVKIESELLQYDSVIATSDKALEIYPNQSVLWLYNGIGHYMKHDYKKSTTSLEQGKKLAGADKELLLQYLSMLGDSYNGVKEYKKSDESYEEALKIDANNYTVLNNYSYFLSLRKEKLEYARKMSEKVVKDNPDNPTFLDTYAWILYVMKDFEKSKDVFEKIVNKSDNGTIVEHYGDVLYQLGKKDEAINMWKKAKELGEASELIDKKIADKKLYE
ncbi:MAG: tetratricopeptide repeat protein [Bacteroidota bacterium]|nr:tetratricopeptide repeat protein [Bacteroidota bacterium]